MSVERSAKIITIEGTDCSGKETQAKNLLQRLLDEGYKAKLFSFPNYELPTGRIVGECYLGKRNKENLTLQEIEILFNLLNDKAVKKLIKEKEAEAKENDVDEPFEYTRLLKKGLNFLQNNTSSFFKEGAANVDPLIASVLYAANRREAFLKEIEEEIFKCDVIILDRYTTSNLGHQGGKAKDEIKRNLLYDKIFKLEYDIMELPQPDLTLFLHMPRKAILELMKSREELDEHESNETHLIEAEKSYLNLVNKYGWEYIWSSKVENYESLKDLKTKEEIAEEIYKKVIEKLTDKKKMTSFLEKE